MRTGSLRQAFDTKDDPYLPEEILWRQKEQFSDGGTSGTSALLFKKILAHISAVCIATCDTGVYHTAAIATATATATTVKPLSCCCDFGTLKSMCHWSAGSLCAHHRCFLLLGFRRCRFVQLDTGGLITSKKPPKRLCQMLFSRPRNTDSHTTRLAPKKRTSRLRHICVTSAPGSAMLLACIVRLLVYMRLMMTAACACVHTPAAQCTSIEHTRDSGTLQCSTAVMLSLVSLTRVRTLSLSFSRARSPSLSLAHVCTCTYPRCMCAGISSGICSTSTFRSQVPLRASQGVLVSRAALRQPLRGTKLGADSEKVASAAGGALACTRVRTPSSKF